MVRAAIEPLFALAPALARLEWIATDGIEGVDGEEVPDVDPDGAAFLQYTSGSTGTPRGVVLTHRNLIHNSARIREAFGYAPGSRGVIWLPPYHDMGLIGGILQPLYGDIDVVLMSPLDFLARPMRWLEAISRTRAAMSGGPNFAFDLCVRKSSPAERARLDLSSWEVAFNGAEPVRAETLSRFAEAFAPAGFRRRGAVSLLRAGRVDADRDRRAAPDGGADGAGGARRAGAGARGRGRRRGWRGGGRRRMSRWSGAGARSTTARSRSWMRRPASAAATARWARSGWPATAWRPATSAGRRRQRACSAPGPPPARGRSCAPATSGSCCAASCSSPDGSPISIIVRGRNHHAADVERTAERDQRRDPSRVLGGLPGRGRRSARRARRRGRARRRMETWTRCAAALRRAVAEEHELQLDAVVLVRAGTVPKTSSGKIERHGCRRAFVDGGLAELARSELDGDPGDGAPSDLVEPRKREGGGGEPPKRQNAKGPGRSSAKESVEGRFAGGAGAPRPFGASGVLAVPSSPPSRLGGSTGQEGAPSPGSLRRYLVAAVARLARVRPEDVAIDQPVIALGLDSLAALELQSLLESELGAAVPAVELLRGATLEQIAARVELQLGRVSPATRPELGEAIEYPLSIGQRALWFLQLLAPESAAYNVWVAARTVGAVDAEALRAACQGLLDRHPSLRAAVFLRDGVPWQRVAPRPVDFEVIDAGGLDEQGLRDALAAEAHRPFDLAAGVLRARLYRRPDGSGALLLVAHHMAIDLWSAGLLLAELTGRDPDRAGRPFADHVAAQATWVAGSGGDEAWAAWQETLSGHLPALALPLDRPRPRRQSFRGAARSFAVDAATVERVRLLARGERTTAYAVLLSAFAAFLHRVSGQDDLVIGSPTAGREPGFERTVGYFVNPVPIRADLSGAPSFRQLVRPDAQRGAGRDRARRPADGHHGRAHARRPAARPSPAVPGAVRARARPRRPRR